MHLPWIAPESRFLVKILFKRNFDHFSDGAQSTTNWIVLGLDLWLLFLIF